MSINPNLNPHMVNTILVPSIRTSINNVGVEYFVSRCTSTQIRLLVKGALQAMEDAVKRPLFQEVDIWWKNKQHHMTSITLHRVEHLLQINPNYTLEQIRHNEVSKISAWDEVSRIENKRISSKRKMLVSFINFIP